VKALKKPSLSAWAVNRLAREDPDSLRKLMGLRDEIAGAGGADEVRELSRTRLELVGRLTDRAAELLREAGHAASSEALRRISQTLQAGATDEERDLILGGRLSAELSPAAFGGLGEWAAAPAPAKTGRGGRTKAGDSTGPQEAHREEARRRSEELASAAKEAEEEARRLAEVVKRSERELKRARSAADAALDRAERARARARAAADALDA
jgi:hypothetical protein